MNTFFQKIIADANAEARYWNKVSDDKDKEIKRLNEEIKNKEIQLKDKDIAYKALKNVVNEMVMNMKSRSTCHE
jgi:hypothetical protein